MFSRKSSPVSARSAQSVLEQSAKLLPQSALARAYTKRRRGSVSANTFRPSRAGAIKEWHDSNFPAPRLVGVETNPGPRPQGGAASAAAVGYALANALAKTKKKKQPSAAKKKRKPTRSPLAVTPGLSMTRVTAPAHVGVRTSVSNTKHSPMIIKGKSYAFGILQMATGSTYLQTYGGATTAINNFNIDPMGSGTTTINFNSFPNNLRTLCSCFLQYRWKRLVYNFVPVQSTAAGGNIIIASCPETVFASVGDQPFGAATSLANQATSPIWAPFSIDLLGEQGLRRDWCYIDSAAMASQAEAREECAGSVFISTVGVAIPGSTTLIGQVYMDFELEFTGLGAETNLYLKDPALQTTTTHDPSCSSSSSVPLPTVPDRSVSDSPEYETVHGTCCPTITRHINTNFTPKQL